MYYLENNIIIVSNTLLRENSIPYRMKYIICALAITILASSSCKSKEESNPVPDIGKESPLPQQPAPSKPSTGDHHECEHCDDEGKCHHKHKRLPPGHEKKLHCDKSARKYAPGHRKH